MRPVLVAAAKKTVITPSTIVAVPSRLSLRK
jgi:hypothetical protein